MEMIPEDFYDPDVDSPWAHIRDPRKRKFLVAYAVCGRKKAACRAIGLDWSDLYKPSWRKDQEFQDAVLMAEQMACDGMEDEVRRRAFEGVRKRVGWYKGKAGAVERQYDSSLAMFTLSGLMPERYKRQLHEHRGAFANIDPTQLTDAQIERLARGENPMAVLATPPPLPPGRAIEPAPPPEPSDDSGEPDPF